MNTFSELSLSAVLDKNLARNGFTEPTPVQAQAIPPQLEGRDVVVTAQTGTGKTLAFVLPLIERLTKQKGSSGVDALILSPTRELALQIDEVFRKLASGTGLRSAVVVGGMSEQPQLRNIRQGARVIIATPGRLSDYLGRHLVSLAHVNLLVLDEADRMLDMGFLPTLEEIMAAMPGERQTTFFSATQDPTVAHLIRKFLKEPVRIAIGSPTKPAEHVDLHLYEVEQDRKLGLLEKMLADESGTFLVFARTKHGVDRLAKQLKMRGANAARIHGDRTQSQRNQALRGFQQGDFRILVATDVAARGIHVEGIAHVVNYDLPQIPEDFIHRVGRTGRAGARGTATTFGTRQERGAIVRIERMLGVKLQRQTLTGEMPREAALMAAATPPPHVVREMERDATPPQRGSSAPYGSAPYGAPRSAPYAKFRPKTARFAPRHARQAS
jgi:ATP-dependent RNA helicase RhlE